MSFTEINLFGVYVVRIEVHRDRVRPVLKTVIVPLLLIEYSQSSALGCQRISRR